VIERSLCPDLSRDGRKGKEENEEKEEKDQTMFHTGTTFTSTPTGPPFRVCFFGSVLDPRFIGANQRRWWGLKVAMKMGIARRDSNLIARCCRGAIEMRTKDLLGESCLLVKKILV